MLFFKDRKDAGDKLSAALADFKDDNSIVLGLTNGGLKVGYETAKKLNCDFYPIIVRKLSMPNNPYHAFGAITEDGSFYIRDQFRNIDPVTQKKIYNAELYETNLWARRLRQRHTFPKLENKTVVLIDDGIDTGAKMTVAIKLCKGKNASKLIVAAPIARQEVKIAIQHMVDHVIILSIPPHFKTFAQVYEDWQEMSDKDVLIFLDFLISN